jgi:hypothetical protein
MDEMCNAFEDFRRKREQGCTERERRGFEEHLASCPACRDQWAADGALLDLFSASRPPGLSPSFNKELIERIRDERPFGSFIMKTYWLVAGLASVALFLGTVGTGLEQGAAVLLLCLALPTLWLGYLFRLNLLDVISSSMNRTERKMPCRQS